MNKTQNPYRDALEEAKDRVPHGPDTEEYMTAYWVHDHWDTIQTALETLAYIHDHLPELRELAVAGDAATDGKLHIEYGEEHNDHYSPAYVCHPKTECEVTTFANCRHGVNARFITKSANARPMIWVNRGRRELSNFTHKYGYKIESVCVDSLGRRMTCGGDFQLARDEETFPVYYFIECQTLKTHADAIKAAEDGG